MRAYFAITFGLILLSRLDAQTQNGGSISGIITNRATGEPVRKAEVTVLDSHDAFGTALADSEGRFQVSGLPPGEYRVRVDHQGFERAAYGSRGPDRPGKIITLAQGEVRSGLAIGLQPLGVITGVVLDQDGDPLPQAQVQLFRSVFRRGKRHLEHSNMAITNERGEYRLYHVAPGRYYLMALSNRGPIVRNTRTAGDSPPAISMLGEQFYPGADDLSGAEAVTPIPGKELRGIDFRLRIRLQAHLRARLSLPSDAPAKGRWEVLVASPDLSDWSNRNHGGELPADTFEDTNVDPGKYILVAQLTAGDKRYRGVQTVDLASGAEQQVTIPLQPTADLSGAIQVEGAGAEKYRRFEVNLVSGDGVPGFGRSPRANTKEDLHFTLSNVPAGVWDINVDPIPTGGFVKGMYLGDQDVLTGDMVIGPKSPASLKIVIGTQGAKLDGDLAGDPLKDGARATILLAPAGKFSRVLSFFHTKVTDAKGHFSMDGLSPGQYNVFAFEDLAPDAYLDPEFLKPFAKRGQPVELREGQTASSKPLLIPASPIDESHE
jgi:protocatechuate 3,4-dioxygenase beta subunit